MNIIAHTADLHIRLEKREKEYYQVFENFFISLEKNKVDTVVVAGDLFHCKNVLSPEAIKLAYYFLDTLAKKYKVIIIKGNHDCVVKQKNRLDAITPIYESIKKAGNNNIFYFKESGLFKIDDSNITYGVFNIDDEEDKFPIKIEKKEGEVYIALFHGAIENAVNEFNFKLTGRYNVEIFSQYDFCFFGDIHRSQAMRYRGTFYNPDAAYPGSLLSQTFAEENHKGYLLWDIKSREEYSVDFVKVKNDYGFYTITLDKFNYEGIKKTISDSKKLIPANPAIRILFTEEETITHSQEKEIKNVLNELGLVPTQLNVKVVHKKEEKNKLNNHIILDVENFYDLDVQLKCISDFLKDKEIEEEDLAKVKAIHQSYYNKLKNVEFREKANSWAIKSIKFSNTFSYGESNQINFKELDGIVGIFSKNRSGKSSFLDSILMGIFNSCSRINRKSLAGTINRNKDKASIEIELQINNEEHLIQRSFNKNKQNRKKSTNETTWLKLNSLTNEYEDIGGKANNVDIQNNIYKILGTFEEYRLTAFGLQSDIYSLINLTQSERKEILSRLIGLNIIKDLYELFKEDYLVIKKKVEGYKDSNFLEELEDYRQQQDYIEEKLNESSLSLRKIEEEIKGKEQQIREEERRLNLLNSKQTADPANVESEFIQLTERKNKTESIIKGNKAKIIFLQEKNKKMLQEKKEALKQIDGEDVILVYEEKKGVEEDIRRNQTEQKILERNISNLRKNAELLSAHDWFASNEYCQKCMLLTNAFSAKKQLVEENRKIEDICLYLKEDQKKLLVINEKVSFVASAKALTDEITINNDNVGKLINENNALNETFSFIEKTLIEKKELLLSLKKEESSTSFIKEIEETILNLKALIRLSKQEQSNSFNSINNLNMEKGKLIQKIESNEQQLKNQQETEEKFNVYSILNKVLSKDGIQSFVIKRIIPKLNNEIKKIISDMVNFDLFFEADEESQDINIYIKDGLMMEREIELCSGMEKTISAIAIRAALTNISLLPKCNLFIIDEGFGSLDTEHINNVHILLNSLKNMYEIVIVISHINDLQDICDHLIKIEKDSDGYSFIVAS